MTESLASHLEGAVVNSVSLELTQRFPDAKWLNASQLSEVEKKYKQYINDLPHLLGNVDLRNHEPILDKKTKLFIQKKWLVIKVKFITTKGTMSMPLDQFLTKFIHLLSQNRRVTRENTSAGLAKAIS